MNLLEVMSSENCLGFQHELLHAPKKGFLAEHKVDNCICLRGIAMAHKEINCQIPYIKVVCWHR